MRLFISGGAGFIGSNFIHHLLSRETGFQVVNYDALTYAGNLRNLEAVASLPGYSFVKGNICDGQAVREAMQGCDAVVHFAAESHVDRSIYHPEPIIETNVRGTFVMLQAARELKIHRFLHVSTDEVYGDIPPGQTSDEDYPLQPNSPYSASKAASDMLVRSFVRTYGFPGIITRASNNYGPYQFPEKFLPLMICNAMEDKPLPVYGDGLQEREWLHVEDHCRALLLVLQHGREGEVYNIGGAATEPNLSLARRILRALGRPESLISYVTDRPGHDRRYALNSQKIQRELGWSPQVGLEEGIAQTIAWYQKNAAWLEQVRSGDYQRYYETYYTNRDQSLKATMRAH
jgi:dTDP-glucose 4,6-dehydratase